MDMYKRMLEQRSQLPVFQYKSALIEAIKKNRVVVVKGATGCGKTTQVWMSNWWNLIYLILNYKWMGNNFDLFDLPLYLLHNTQNGIVLL